MSDILVQDVCKRFGEFVALDHVTVEVASGQLLALLGPSGSGKTTLLRILLGDEEPSSGLVQRGHLVFPGYLDQHLAILDPEKSVMRAVWPDDGVAERVAVLGSLPARTISPRESVRRPRYAVVATMDTAQRVSSGAWVFFIAVIVIVAAVFVVYVVADRWFRNPATGLRTRPKTRRARGPARR